MYSDCNQIRKVYTALSTQSGLLGTIAKIDKFQIPVFFDTGAEISTKTAAKYNIQINPSDIKVKVADNTINDVIGKTNPLNVTLGDSYCNISFLVMEHDDHPILLGLDWFSMTDASLNPSQNTITFQRKT